MEPRQVRKAVIPAAGLGTRFLPVTKSVPKELLPILDKPMLHYVAEEASQAGIEQIILVVSPGKGSISDYFRPAPRLESHLNNSSVPDLARKVQTVSSLAVVSEIIQEEPLGLGHAILMAKDAVGDEPFVVMLPDDIIDSPRNSPGATEQMLEVFKRHGGGVVAVEPMPWAAIENYGVVDSSAVAEQVGRIRGLVEKPTQETAPSNLAIVGRYILPPEVFACLERTTPGAKGEIQLTDGLVLLLESFELYSYEFHGRRYDGGTPLGLLRAALEFGLAREDTRHTVRAMLEDLT